MPGIICFLAFAATVPLANWMIANVGQCVPEGPCLIPVGFGLMAPSGVLVIGLALVLRDAVHAAFGWRIAALAIALGAILSGLLAPAPLAIASVAAFVIGEVLDLAFFARLRARSMALAILVSGIVGAAADSIVFLWTAFGSLDYLAGQIVGKLYATAVFAAIAFKWGPLGRRAVQIMRGRLPDRRPSMTFAAHWNGHTLTGTVGFDPVTGRVLEVFGDPQKGSMQATIADAMVLTSIALQRGATVEELRRSLLVETDYTGAETPASPIGAILKAVESLQAEIWGDIE